MIQRLLREAIKKI